MSSLIFEALLLGSLIDRRFLLLLIESVSLAHIWIVDKRAFDEFPCLWKLNFPLISWMINENDIHEEGKVNVVITWRRMKVRKWWLFNGSIEKLGSIICFVVFSHWTIPMQTRLYLSICVSLGFSIVSIVLFYHKFSSVNVICHLLYIYTTTDFLCHVDE